MNKLVLTGALGFALTATAAHAQSNITLYGVIDTGPTYVNNQGGHAAWVMNDSISQGDRFGFKGLEDLGGGLSSVFNLESGFNPNTGASRQGGLEFGRQAWVGLQDRTYGTVRFGRTYDQMTATLIRYHSGFWSGIYAFDIGDHDRISGSWLNNAVSYTSPSVAGVIFNAQYAFNSLGATSNGYGSTYSLSASYDHGPLSIGAAMTHIHDYATTPGSSFGVATFLGQNVNFGTTSINVSRYRTAGLGASYEFGKLGVAGLYTNSHYEYGAASETIQSLNANVHYRIVPTVIVEGGYGVSRMAGYRWNELNAIVDYLLSKRTDVYASVNYDKASGGARAGLVTLAISSNQKELAMRVGIRHKF